VDPLARIVSVASDPGRKGSRRPSHVVRAELFAAARELFAERGYQAVTTKELCQRAGVAETTLFRHFGSKAELFEATIAEPFAEFIDGWSASWAEFPPDAPLEELARRLVTGLYDLVSGNRELLQQLVVARFQRDADFDQLIEDISSRIAVALRSVQDAGTRMASVRGVKGLDPPATIRAIAGMIFGSVLLDDWIDSAGTRRPGRARFIHELTALTAHGFGHRTDL